MEKSIVGKPINFRGLMYSLINEEGVVYLFGLVAGTRNGSTSQNMPIWWHEQSISVVLSYTTLVAGKGKFVSIKYHWQN